MSATGSGLVTPSSIPVSVLLERRYVSRGQWSVWQWDAVAVVAGEGVTGAAGRRTQVQGEEGREQYLWTGLRLDLFKDACEGYWFNLLSAQPYLFIICFEDEEDEIGIRPRHVTASQDEANAHMENDDPVYSVPMPEQVHQWVERFVLEHYEPAIKKKRKRRDWFGESEDAQRRRKTPGDGA